MFPRKNISCWILAVIAVATATPSTKINPKLIATLRSQPLANIFVKFQGGSTDAIKRVNLLPFQHRAGKITHLVTELKALSRSSQKSALDLLKARSPFSSVQQIWITNELYVKDANAVLVNELASLPEVEEIREEQEIPLEPLDILEISDSKNTNEVQWNLEIIEATLAWQIPGGNNGSGVVVANIDSGVRATHEALRNNFRENYGWYDPLREELIPHDASGHGSHTMGSLAGAGGIGVAPGAQWIACRGCGAVCAEFALKACAEWILCPTLPNGTNPDCSKAPNVVSNSWGGGNDSWYTDVIEAWKAAEIIPVFSNGNSGPSCGSTGAPASLDVIAVGSTTSNDSLATSSSAGPTESGVIKPDISVKYTAPGHLIRSSSKTNDTSYVIASGTSMACPHTAGVVALLLSQNPNLTYTQIKQLLLNNADRNLVDTGRDCGGIPSTQFPNNQYGHGRINARKSLAAAISGF